MRVEHQLQDLAGFIMSHSDPVLKSHLEDLNNEAVAVMKKRDDVLGSARWLCAGALCSMATRTEILRRSSVMVPRFL